MAKNHSNNRRSAQGKKPKEVGPFDDAPSEWSRDIPSNVLSLDLSEHSDDELAERYESSKTTYSDDEVAQAQQRAQRGYTDDEFAEMYESARSTGSVEELEQARQRSLRGHTDEELARRYRLAKGGPVRPKDVNFVAATDDTAATPSLVDYDVREVITEEFGEEGWTVMKPLLATHATLLLDDIGSSRAIVIESRSGVGKTMLLKTFGGLNEQFCRRSGITPASFVSAGPSKSKDDPDNDDLLPQLEGRTLTVRDAQTWFAGSEQTVRSRWGKLARMMDGDGYYRHTATHGKVGYDDIRFNFIGATTPLDPRAWNVMGNVGQRLLFVEWPEEDYEDGWLGSMLDGGERQPVERGRDAVQEFLQDLWTYHGGPGSVTWTDEPMDHNVEVALERFATVVVRARGSVKNGRVDKESPRRIGKLLHDLARGHALIHGRTRLESKDLDVCGRVALSTMPAKRRGIVRALLNPNRGALTASDVEDLLGVSRPTARDRIDEVAALGLGEVVKETGRGGTTKAVQAKPEFSWPDALAFPEF